jgi:hypothetical protein
MNSTIIPFPMKLSPSAKRTIDPMLTPEESGYCSADIEARYYAGLAELRQTVPDANFVLLQRVISDYGRLCMALGHPPGQAVSA